MRLYNASFHKGITKAPPVGDTLSHMMGSTYQFAASKTRVGPLEEGFHICQDIEDVLKRFERYGGFYEEKTLSKDVTKLRVEYCYLITGKKKESLFVRNEKGKGYSFLKGYPTRRDYHKKIPLVTRGGKEAIKRLTKVLYTSEDTRFFGYKKEGGLLSLIYLVTAFRIAPIPIEGITHQWLPYEKALSTYHAFPGIERSVLDYLFDSLWNKKVPPY